MKIDLTIDGRKVRVSPGATVLQAAREAGIEVPTLCHLDGFEAYGACRLCVVEVSALAVPRNDGARGPARIVSSCHHPATPDLDVRTRSERVDLVRKTVFDLLLARCPESEELRELARAHGVERTTYVPDQGADRCTLCGTCVRVCAEVGTRAISAVGRGRDRRIAPPFDEPPEACIGCLACARACPTSNIPYTDDGARRRIWNRDFERVPCPSCGKRGGTREQIAWYAARHGFDESAASLCDSCKRARTALTFFDLMKL